MQALEVVGHFLDADINGARIFPINPDLAERTTFLLSPEDQLAPPVKDRFQLPLPSSMGFLIRSGVARGEA